MIQFYGYNDARAIAAYNKRNLTKMFLIFALICIAISIVAIAIHLYCLLNDLLEKCKENNAIQFDVDELMKNFSSASIAVK